ncbi:peptidoglycan-binding protein [Anabaena sp. FACHB-1250]|uniref:glycoside hydrolase family protein n=1 Tax=Anabaena sp. FACHB-1250 TaxID=2692770 RepID=UPI0016814902|nr:peptidoglycan-binding protein [Anabaena sp. FACHB-1250]MBD2141201.1 peptidoglycan-binding protein [Anabaena sp. FACHB-1250]
MANKLNLDSGEILKQGANGAKVQQLQEILKALNLDPGTIDGDFGNNTVKAVKQFQSQNGLNADGIVGKNTQNALNNALDQLTTDPVPSLTPQTNGFGGVTGKLPLPAIPLIKKFEGCYLKAYPDPRTGNLPITIGWGSTKKRDGSNWKLGESITQQEADDLLMLQLENNYLPSLQKIPVWNELNTNQQGALLSFGYNLGANFYGSSSFKSMTRVLRDKKWDEIEETFLKYRNPGSNVEVGLRRRRQAEADLFLTPV